MDVYLAHEKKCSTIGIDINSESIEQAKVHLSEMKFADAFIGDLDFQNISIEDFSAQNKYARRFDRVITNPPYYAEGKGRLSPSEPRNNRPP